MGPLVEATELSKSLIEAGNNLLKPYSSTDEILALLDNTDSLLSTVEQDPTTVVQNALIPSMKALVSADLLRNPDSDVRVFVVSCLTEIMRITAPEAPYSDDQIKEIFKVTVEAFEKLADASCRSYKKAVGVLDTVSKVRSSLVMLDLECDDLILEMFHQFLKIISPDHPRPVLLSMETIMITVIDESEEISMDLLDILLTTVKKDSQDVSPMALKLVEKVISSCADKLQPCIMEALKSTGTGLDTYSPVVLSICESKAATAEEHISVDPQKIEADEKISEEQVVPSDTLQDKLALGISRKGNRSKRTAKGGNRQASGDNKVVNGNDLRQLLKQGQSESTDAETESGSTRRRRQKPNSLMNPEEGYSFKTSSSKKVQEKKLGGSSLGKRATKKASSPSKVGQTNQSVVVSLSGTSRARTGSNKRSRSKMEETDLDVVSLDEPAAKKQIVKKGYPEEDVVESDLEKPEDIKTARSSKKERAQNGLATASAKKALAETNSVKTTPQSSQNKKKNSRSTTPSTESKSFGVELVGKRVNVWWPIDKIYYEGVIESYSSRKKMHKVLYSDGEAEELNLKTERWEIIEDKSSDNEDKKIDLSESVTLSDLLRRNKKAKKIKSVSMNVEPSSSADDRSSMQTTEKKDSVTNSTKQGKRTKRAVKVVSNEPQSREERNQKRQKVAQDRQQESEKDCDEKEEPETKGEDGLNLDKELNAELEGEKDQRDLPADPNAQTKTDGEELKSESETDTEEQEVAKELIAEPKTDEQKLEVVEEPTFETKTDEENPIIAEEPTSEPQTDGQEHKSVKEPNEEPGTEVQEQESAKVPTAETKSIEEDTSDGKESDKDRHTSVPETDKVEIEAEEDDQRLVKEQEEETEKTEVDTIPGTD
ncbi:unnamed protein product [Cochlearia groenlandica]